MADIEPDDMLDDIGLDSMMAMDFRVRINTTFSIDLPVLEILRGVSVNSLAVRVLAELRFDTRRGALGHRGARGARGDGAITGPRRDDVDRLIDELSEADLRELLAELEAQPVDPQPEGCPTMDRGRSGA